MLCKIKDKLKGNVKLIFQPAEEGVGGATHGKEGVLGPHVDACAALHAWPDIPAGKAAVTMEQYFPPGTALVTIK